MGKSAFCARRQNSVFSAPADHGSVVHAQGRVGDDQLFVDADDAAEPFAYGAGTDRRVESE